MEQTELLVVVEAQVVYSLKKLYISDKSRHLFLAQINYISKGIFPHFERKKGEVNETSVISSNVLRINNTVIC